MATKTQIKNRNKPKERGRVGKPNIGNAQSIIDAIQHVQDKVSAQTAKDLETYYEMMEQLAKGKGDFEKAGIKDRVMAVKWHIELADQYLSEHYESLEDEDGGEGSDSVPNQGKATGTDGKVVSLIDMEFDED